MHIIIGVITAVAGLLWALHSLQNAGVDLNAFNPFTWVRRRRWEKRLGVKPIHALSDSMDAAAVLVVAVAKAQGEITRNSKMEILGLFEETLGLSRAQAIELFSSCCYMLRDEPDMAAEVRQVLAPSKAAFQHTHVQKLLAMLNQVAALEGEPSPRQRAIIKAVHAELNAGAHSSGQW